MPSTLSGALHPSNKNCIDWNSFGAVAYGSHNCLLIVDAFTQRRVQSIEHHADAINNVCWAPPPSIDVSKRDNSYRIASSDIAGQIIVSDSVSAAKCSQFSHASSTVLAMQWFKWKDICCDYIIVLHSGSTLILWNAESGDKIWSHTYTYPLLSMVLDPFNSKHITFLSSSSSLLLVRDVHLNNEPFSNGYHAVLSEDTNQTTVIQSIHYHKAYRNSLLIIMNGKICMFDTDLCAVLVSIQCEPNITTLNSCSLRDAIFTVQSNGSVSLRVGTYRTNDDRADAQFSLEKIVSSETLRHGAQQRVVAAALCPVTQSTLAVLYNSGRVLFWQLSAAKMSTAYRATFIDDYLSFDQSLFTKAKSPLSLHQSGFVGALSSGVSCVRMRPMDELSKLSDDPFTCSDLGSAHIAAVGTHAGGVHLVDVFTSQVIKEFSVQSSPIKSLEWGGAYVLLTAGFNHALSSTQVVRNDIYATDIRTGLSRRIRPEADESPVTLMRVSFYHCYLALAFQREPLEIWDLKGFRLLRKMSRTCPLIIDMAWSSKHHTIKTTETSGQSVYRENLVVLDSDNRLYHVIVKGLHVKDGKEVNTQWKSGGWSIRTMAWKDDILAMGDADGRVAIWDLGRRQSRHVRSSRMPVLRMTFSRLAGDHTLAVLHQRELSLWDTEALTRMHQIVIDPCRAALDMDLCGVSPIMITNDNVFRFAPNGNKNNCMLEKEIPVLMNPSKIESIIADFDISKSENALFQLVIAKKVSVGLLDSDDRVDLSPLRNESLLSRFLGDSYSHSVLEAVCHYLSLDDGLELLPPSMQMFWPNNSFRERELRVTCAACASTTVMESRLVERAVVAGGKAKDRAVDRLIGSSDLRHASLKAALLVSSQESEQARSLIKLIATNLIASDMIEDGVELLFLVGAGADACKYLQSQKQWHKSVVYAKMGLDDSEEVFSKWVMHLQVDDKARFVLAQCSRGEWPSVVEQLSSSGRSRLARLILRTTTSSPQSTHRASPISNRS